MKNFIKLVAFSAIIFSISIVSCNSGERDEARQPQSSDQPVKDTTKVDSIK